MTIYEKTKEMKEVEEGGENCALHDESEGEGVKESEERHDDI